MSWSAASDNVGVAGYSVYLNGTKVATMTATSHTYTGLVCGSTYTVGLEAFDAAGNRFRHPIRERAGLDERVSDDCRTPDTQAPSVPTGLSVGAVTQTSIAVSWSASSDNVGVAGYGYYRGGALVGSGAGTSYTFSGLACGTSYSLAVDAYDAAGNRSAKASRERVDKRLLCSGTSAAAASVAARPPGSGLAQVWVDVSGGLCVRSVSAVGYVDGQACGSLQAAYNVAQAGDTVLVVAGTYGRQLLPAGSKAGDDPGCARGDPGLGSDDSACIQCDPVRIPDRS